MLEAKWKSRKLQRNLCERSSNCEWNSVITIKIIPNLMGEIKEGESTVEKQSPRNPGRT